MRSSRAAEKVKATKLKPWTTALFWNLCIYLSPLFSLWGRKERDRGCVNVGREGRHRPIWAISFARTL